MSKILILHGPNMNILGSREPHIYGTTTLDLINEDIHSAAADVSIHVTTLQSNAEHELIAHIHQAKQDNVDFIIINPAAYTHTSVALRDALLSVHIPFIEVHMSNIFAREEFRQHSYLADIAVGVISGFGGQSYLLALDAAQLYLTS